jgi:hypothetical protein
MASTVTKIDGSVDWSGGINSLRVPTVQSDQNPNGLPRNCLSWGINCTVRGGGILPRCGWKLNGTISDGSALYQGGFLYEPDQGDPYFIVSIGGHILLFYPDFTVPPVDLSAFFSLTNPATVPHAYFCQAEKFLIIQAGDLVTLPLFFDGTTLRRSIGITNPGVLPGTPAVNELPAATAMDYFMGRVWYAQGRNYSAGDIVGGQSGTLANKFRDSVLNVTENPLVLGGDGFTVPTQAGNIRAIFHNANLNQPLGQGQLLIGTRKAIYAQDVPVTRADWIAADAANQPKQTVVQLVNGPVNDRSVVRVNGDVFFQTLEPSIASLFASVRDFGTWGNRSISGNEQRILAFNDRGLLSFASGTVFDNRLLQTALPKQLPQGVVHQALVPLDFLPINEFNTTLAPVWEGMSEGLNFLQIFSGDFGGRERAFGAVVSAAGAIELWEITNSLRSDFNALGESRVTMVIETPAWTWGSFFELKKLVAAEFSFDKVFGEVLVNVEFRPDSDPCWRPYKQWKICTARNSAEDVVNPVSYPQTDYRESFKTGMTLPLPQQTCTAASGRPSNLGFQFQFRITVKGWARIRSMLFHAETVDKALWGGDLVC